MRGRNAALLGLIVPEVRFRPRALPDNRFHPLLYLENF
jgi:hypothetical protein